MLKAYKYRIYLKNEQKIQITKTFGCCRFVYNQTLAYRKDKYEKDKKFVSKTDCNNYCNRVLKKEYDVMILLETMAGKGTELGRTLEEMKYLIDHVENKEKIGVCIDTCHLNDAGYNMASFDEFLALFEQEIGINYIKCVHINDSKNILSAHKDRHANIGYGTIGFETLLKIINHEALKDIPKILETPYIGNSDDDKERLYPPYKFEIAMIREGKFNYNMMNDIREFYNK